MLEVLLAIKNNNVKKLPNYDSEHQQFLTKNMKAWLNAGATHDAFKIRMEDLGRKDDGRAEGTRPCQRLLSEASL